MGKQRSKIRDVLEYLGVRLLEALFHIFDVRLNYRTVRLIADAGYFLNVKHRRIAVEHLRRSFPDWSEQRCRAVARQSMRSVLYTGLETLFTTRLIHPRSWRRHIRLHNMTETLRLLTERKTGLILMTGHFGNFEVVTYMMAVIGIPTYSIARTLDNPYLNEHLLGVRQRHGQVILDKQGATREVPDLLRQREAVCFVADQDAGRKGLFVDFFGRKASTYKSFGLLAMEHEVPIVIGYGRRLDLDYRFEVGIQRIIYPREWAGRDDPLEWITQEYTSALEQLVRTDPTQYWWSHRRWKHRPRGEEPSPDGVA